MFRNNSPPGYDIGSYAESLLSNGYSTMDDSASQVSGVSGMSRPSAKSIYMQRKEYASSINKAMDKFQHRVEHLFTCDLDGKELANISDCVERLKLLDETGRVWGQNMLLEVREGNMRLIDIESKEELESIALSDIQDLKARAVTEVFNSLLVISVQPRRKNTTTVLMFQCEDVKAEYVEKDLARAMSNKKDDPGFSSNAGNGRMNAMPQWASPDYEDDEMFPNQDEDASSFRQTPLPTLTGQQFSPANPYTELDRNVDILNHIVNDVETFTGQIVAAKNVKKKSKKKKGKAMSMPSPDEFATCLHKIKYAFNVLGELNGQINNPSAADFVHTFFTAIGFVVSHGPVGLASHIVAPLLTPECIRLLSEEASQKEDELWQSLGEPWNIPSNKWPEDHDNIPVYTLKFSDGWVPPEVNAFSRPASRQESPQVFREPASRQESPQAFRVPASRQESPQAFRVPASRQESPQAFRVPASRQESPQVFREPLRRQESPQAFREPLRRQESPPAAFREPFRRQESPHPPPSQVSTKWDSPRPPQKERSNKSNPNRMRVKYDFISRNQRELTIWKGEIVELLDKSKQWWKVRNSRGEEGFVPNNVLEPDDGQTNEDIVVSPVLKKSSKPSEVKAWLEDQSFSHITVRCLGGLSGSMLLGMSREELKTVCPEEGGRVFFKLQAVKSTMAANSVY